MRFLVFFLEKTTEKYATTGTMCAPKAQKAWTQPAGQGKKKHNSIHQNTRGPWEKQDKQQQCRLPQFREDTQLDCRSRSSIRKLQTLPQASVQEDKNWHAMKYVQQALETIYSTVSVHAKQKRRDMQTEWTKSYHSSRFQDFGASFSEIHASMRLFSSASVGWHQQRKQTIQKRDWFDHSDEQTRTITCRAPHT